MTGFDHYRSKKNETVKIGKFDAYQYNLAVPTSECSRKF